MRLTVSLTTAIAFPALLVAGCNKPAPKADVEQQKTATADAPAPVTPAASSYTVYRDDAGKPMPMVDLTDANGGKVSLTKFTGKPYLLVLWASVFQDSVDQLSSLDALAAEGKFPVVAVSGDLRPASDFPDRATPVLKAQKIKALTDYRDVKNAMVMALHYTVPNTILVDSKGHQVLRINGKADFNNPDVRNLLEEAK